MARRRHHFAAMVLVLASLVGLSACGDDRPSEQEWGEMWEAQRDGLPSVDEFVEQGRDGCDDLLGRLRSELDELRTTPSDELDDEFAAWAARAESLAFECPTEPDEVATRLGELDVLASSIDAAIAAES